MAWGTGTPTRLSAIRWRRTPCKDRAAGSVRCARPLRSRRDRRSMTFLLPIDLLESEDRRWSEWAKKRASRIRYALRNALHAEGNAGVGARGRVQRIQPRGWPVTVPRRGLFGRDHVIRVGKPREARRAVRVTGSSSLVRCVHVAALRRPDTE